MPMRPIQDGEQPFILSTDVSTGGTTKIVERFDMAKAIVSFHSFHGTPGSYSLEGSVDGNNWTKIQIGITSEANLTFTHFWKHLRVFTDSPGTEPPTVSLGAYELTW